MIKELNINIPNWFELDELDALHTVMSPVNDTGVLVASENFNKEKECNPTVRLYLLELQNGKFEITKELDAFSFTSCDEARDFSQKLPNMNALDLVLYLNKRQPLFSA
ncbi:MAG: geranylgeranyl pyrophosphate synthase [Lysinibacillus sp.]